MSVDIGPKIGIDGEKEFRTALQNINQQLKTLGSEMKAVTSAFDANDNSQEALSAQTDVLTRSITAQEQKLSMLQRGLTESAQKYGENDTKTLRWAQAVNNATADLNKMRSALSKTSGELDDASDAADDLANSVDGAGKSASGFGSLVKSAFLGGGIVTLLQSVASGIRDVIDSTAEYRKIMASLEVSSANAGYSAQQTADTYRTLYSVLGDDQIAATTVANLQAIGLAQDQLSQITDAAIGAWATYGDSIPIDSLSEAINETIKTGTVTGTFADVLNWAGTSEDAFNTKLQAANGTAERANLVLQQLASQGLMQAGQAWQQNNTDITAANSAQLTFQQSLASLAETFSPIAIAVQEGVAGIAAKFAELGSGLDLSPIVSVINSVFDAVSGLIGFLAENIEIVTTVTTAIAAAVAVVKAATVAQAALNAVLNANPITLIVTLIASLVAAIITLWNTNDGFREAVTSAWEAVKNAFFTVVDAIKGAVSKIGEFFSGIADKFKELKDKALTWGKDLIMNFVNGIKEKVSAVVDAVKGVANKVKDFLGFSEPDEGPLSNFHTYGPDMMKLYAQGIKDNAWRVTDAVDSVAGQMVAPLPAQVTSADLNNAAAGIVNGINVGQTGGASIPANVVLQLSNGVEIARWLLPDIRKVSKSDPEVATA